LDTKNIDEIIVDIILQEYFSTKKSYYISNSILKHIIESNGDNILWIINHQDDFKPNNIINKIMEKLLSKKFVILTFRHNIINRWIYLYENKL
jgi:hypothetical protein